VDDARHVRRGQRRRHLHDDPEGIVRRGTSPSEPSAQGFADDVLHRDKLLAVSRLAERVNRADVGMIERGGGPRFLFEPRHARFVLRDVHAQHFERNHPVERHVAREPDLAHATASKRSEDVIVLYARPRTDRHVGCEMANYSGSQTFAHLISCVPVIPLSSLTVLETSGHGLRPRVRHLWSQNGAGPHCRNGREVLFA
jgi:hypothetical protein